MIKEVSAVALGIVFHISALCQNMDLSEKPTIKIRDREDSWHLPAVEDLLQPSLFENKKENTYQQLDSIIRYGYNEEVEKWNRKLYKISIYYDDNGNDTLILQSTWDKSGNQWRDIAKELKEFNDANYIKKREFHVIGRSGNRIQYAYNERSNIIEKTESFLKSGEWHYKQRNVYHYNAENLLESDSLYRFNFLGKHEWLNVGITASHYNASGQLVLDSAYARPWLRDNEIGDWGPFNKTTYEYNMGQNSAKKTFSYWDKVALGFTPSKKEHIQYHNEAKDMASLINFEWNKDQNTWDSIKAVHYFYNKDDEMIQYRKQSWGEFPSHVLESLDFDYEVSKEELLLPSSAISTIPAVGFHHMLIGFESNNYQAKSDKDEKSSETKLYYSRRESKVITRAVGENHNNRLNLYPNPASEYIKVTILNTFSHAFLTIYNMNGTSILSEPLKHENTLSINGLKNGIYFYQVEVDNQQYFGKLLIN